MNVWKPEKFKGIVWLLASLATQPYNSSKIFEVSNYHKISRLTTWASKLATLLISLYSFHLFAPPPIWLTCVVRAWSVTLFCKELNTKQYSPVVTCGAVYFDVPGIDCQQSLSGQSNGQAYHASEGKNQNQLGGTGVTRHPYFRIALNSTDIKRLLAVYTRWFNGF